MAFYPDELSPIEKLRSTVKAPELSDLNLMSMNRRQWKSLVLGKKDLAVNNFATITEEKEEDISSDGSNAGGNVQHASDTLVSMQTKKITFPKPRKYITSRVADRKEDESCKISKNLQLKESASERKHYDDLSKIINNPKMNLPEIRQLIKNKKFGEEIAQQEVTGNCALNDLSIDKQFEEVAVTPPLLTGWPKQEEGKGKAKEEKRKKTPSVKTPNKKLEQKKSISKPNKPQPESQNKSLNMKDVVNVYKNLTYGTKDEIKSFVEKLSLVKDNDNVECDRNALSMMNLKALEAKIKDLEKKTGQGSQTKKRGKTGKKTKKISPENLARYKVVKVPATLDYTYSPESRNLSYGSGGNLEQRRKTNDDKVPWKYVGTQSVLDKSYFVYPSYPRQEKKKPVKKSDPESKKTKKDMEESPKGKISQIKVKQSKDVLIRQGTKNEGSRFLNAFALSGNRSSATTVCKVEFQPEQERRLSETAPSLLVYLHGTKAINVKSPYSYKQFSRVKLFRKDGVRAPLVRGLAGASNATQKSLDSDRAFDLLDFEEDIQNINEFLRSQNRNRRPGKLEARTPPKQSNRRRAGNDDLLINEITRGIEGLQYLPDTEENRNIIENFFDELDRRIERSKAPKLLQNDNNNNNNNNNNYPDNNKCLIPIVGY